MISPAFASLRLTPVFHRRLALGPLLALLLLLPAAHGRVTAQRGQLTLPTYPWAAVRHPYFRGTDGLNIYPYPMLDFLSREKTKRTYQTVVLENEYLRVTFLPELGGRIHEVLDKTTGQPMFYVNHVIKPGLIGQCGAWISGGVEWNTGPQGHTVGAVQPVSVLILPPDKDGARAVAIGETERIYGTQWTVVVTLRPGRAFLEERVRIYNPTEHVRPSYFWNCTAVPNTPGFRFIYPMTLGTDHAGEKFFHWPMHQGKDLSRGANYQDAASIFAWQCDQDFFGAYLDDLDRGVVACANHHQLPGKKAWTWGHGGYGTMHQMDLTDTDGPYNEVQTGPLLTQSEVGRLDPCGAIEWQEWWYPVHGLGGFTFANRDVAVNATLEAGGLRLRLLGTGAWSPVSVLVRKGTATLARARCALSPRAPAELRFDLAGAAEPFEVELATAKDTLARFRVPLDLPARQPPKKESRPDNATDLAQTGWRHLLFARFREAEAQFRKALEKDPSCVAAHLGLASLKLDSDPAAAADAARAALKAAPDCGLAWFTLAVAEARLGNDAAALDHAWRAALDPATAVAARAQVAKLLLRRGDWAGVAAALAPAGPWHGDPLCRNRLALALDRLGQRAVAAEWAALSLQTNPLDAFAQHLLAASRSASGRRAQSSALSKSPEVTLELVAEYFALGQLDQARDLARKHLAQTGPSEQRSAPVSVAALGVSPGAGGGAGTGPSGSDRGRPGSVGKMPAAAGQRPALHSGERNRSGGEAAAAGKAWSPQPHPLLALWLDYLDVAGSSAGQARVSSAPPAWAAAPAEALAAVRPHRLEELAPLRWAAEKHPGPAPALWLGHLLFHLGRHAEGRALWQRAVELGADPALAGRALGLAAKTLDGDLQTARVWLEKAHQAEPGDAIVARDLARVLFELADRVEGRADKQALWTGARDTLTAALAEGQGRSDFVALLARAHNRLGEFAETARLLDRVRVTIWEGAREVHDLFEQAHLALGKAHLEAGRPAEALAEFNRALEYPENLATGKLENTREAHIHFLRGNALAALGRQAEAIAAWKLAATEPESKDPSKEDARRRARQALQQAGAALRE